MSRIRPLGGRIVVRRIDSPDRVGSVLLPDSAREKLHEGVVIAVGPGTRRKTGHLIPVDVQIGDHVWFGRGATEIPSEPGLLVMVEADVMGVTTASSAVVALT